MLNMSLLTNILLSVRGENEQKHLKETNIYWGTATTKSQPHPIGAQEMVAFRSSIVLHTDKWENTRPEREEKRI